MASWANLFGYQATWFAVAWSAGHGRAWIGMLACIAFIGVQWRCSHARRADARVVLAALACGLLVDGIAAATGLLAYASAFPSLPAPAWWWNLRFNVRLRLARPCPPFPLSSGQARRAIVTLSLQRSSGAVIPQKPQAALTACLSKLLCWTR